MGAFLWLWASVIFLCAEDAAADTFGVRNAYCLWEERDYKVKKGQIFVGTVEKVAFPNKGMLHLEDGKTVVVKNVLPGQKISFSIQKVRKGKGEGRLLKVLEKSPAELESAPCRHFGACGGCTFLSLPYGEQLKLKEQQVKELLEPVCAPYQEMCGNIPFGDRFEGMKESPRQFGYRNKMEFSFGDSYKGGPLSLGMHKRGSFHDIVTVDGCKIVDGDFSGILMAALSFFQHYEGFQGCKDTKNNGNFQGNAGFQTDAALQNSSSIQNIDAVSQNSRGIKNIDAVLQNPRGIENIDAALQNSRGIKNSEEPEKSTGFQNGQAVGTETQGGAGVPYYHKKSHIGYLRHLLVRKAAKTGEILVDLVTTSQIGREEEERLLAKFCDALLCLKLEGKIVGILNTHNDSLADAVINQGTKVLYGVDHFYEELLGLWFCISPFSFFQTNSLGAEVLYETAREYIADAGNGKVVYDLYSGTGTIAQILAPVAKKVIGVEIVEEAVEAARENAKQNQLGNCEFIAGDVLKALAGIEEKPDVIVLDPPREGIHPKALEQIIQYGVEKMVYISCKPSSLARDLEVLQARGYMVGRACCVDMFPASANIETVVMLTRKSPAK